MDKYDVYGLKASFPKYLATFKARKDIRQENVEDIVGFEEYLATENLSPSRKIKYLRVLTTLSKIYGKPFRSATKKDIEGLFIGIANGKHSVYTIKDFKVGLKKFFKWLRGTSGYPIEVNWLKATLKEESRVKPEDRVTIEELNSIERAVPDLQYKTMFRLQYFSACRPSEICTLTRVNCRFDEKSGFLIIKVSGKTGERSLPIYDARTIELFNAWLQLRGDIENGAFVFTNKHGKMIKPPNYAKTFKQTIKAAGVNKPDYPYVLRHSRISELSDEFTDQQLKQFSGWSPNSNMASNYVHRDLNDLLRAFDKYSPNKAAALDKQIEKEANELLGELFSHKDVLDLIMVKIDEHKLTAKYEKLRKRRGLIQ